MKSTVVILLLTCGLYFPLPSAGDDASPRGIDQLRKDVAALYQEDVAWRKITWKTCLLDGLAASREQGKPIVLWVFIDRPMDDERC
jgi:hypothetical protein